MKNEDHMNNRTKLAANIVMLASAWLATSTPAWAQIRGNLWDNPAFRESLQYSFAVNTEIEPTMTDEESEIFNRIVPLIASNPGEAQRLIEEYIAQFPDASAMWAFTLGNIFFQQDKRKEAEEQFLKAIGKFKNFRRAYQNLGTLYVQSAQHEKAIENLTKVIELGGGDGVLYGLLGVAYISLEQFIPAEIAFRQAILLKPDVDDWKLGLARGLLAQQRYGEVVALMDQMIQKKPEDSMLWSLQTSAYIGLKDVKAAAANLEILKRLDKADAKMLSTLADIYVNEGLMDLAAETYISAFEGQGGGDAQSLVRAAQILLDRKAPDEAQRILAKAKEVIDAGTDDKQKVDLLRLQAKLEAARGNAVASAQLLEEVVAKDPLDGASLLALGKHYAETKNEKGEDQSAKAIFYYERAQGIAEFEADANLRLAQLLVTQGKLSEAIPLLKRAQDIKPRDSVAKFLDDLERFVRGRR